MRRATIMLALVVLALCALAVPAAAKSSAPAARIAFAQQSESRMLARGHIPVTLRYAKAGKLRVFGRIRALGTRRQHTLASTRTIKFNRPGRKVVRLKLTPRAKTLLRKLVKSCKRSRIAIHTRAPSRSRSRRYRDALPPKATCGKPANPGGQQGSPGAGGGPGPARRAAPQLAQGGRGVERHHAAGGHADVRLHRALRCSPTRRGALQIVADPDENLYAKSFEPSDGIHTRVLSRALVFERGGQRLAMVQVDLGGIPYSLVQEVEKRIATTGVTGERLMISATHTHSSTGPIWPTDSNGYSALGGDAFDPRIFELTAEGIAESIRAAAARLEPARVGIGTAELRNASRNRNFDPFRRNADVPGDEAAARARCRSTPRS